MTHSRFSVSQVIKEGFGKTVDHIGVLLKGLFFVFLAIVLVAVGLAVANLGFLAALWSMFPHLQKVQECGTNVACIQAIIQPLVELFAGDAIMLVLSFITISIGLSYIALGYVNYTLRVYDKGAAGFSDLFPSFGRVVKIMVAFFMFILMVSCGLVLLVIPGIYLMLRCGLFAYFILDKNVGIFDSLKMSWHVTRGYCWDLLALLFFALLLHALGNVTIIGWIFAVPMIYVTKAGVYRRLLAAHESSQHSVM